ncbi:hypothetical protein pipiens_001492 [Culex pipiens pipiens]|uniref:Zinc finger CCCH domain-containing protein 14 n=1 Tax=Culex pipiens pipiens TaxID=38569 RepID=A0ABD1CP87_CULPP
MDSLGSEIGQKMRSAVKAKLIELGTGSASGYIDDELPDYVMIMVANKRSRQQMIDDLTLFLAGQTEVFVNWLHQVLQKLEEVTLPAGSQAATAAAATATGGAKEASKAVKESGGKRKGAEQKKDKKKDKKTKRKEKSPEGGAVGVGGEHTPPHPAGQLGGVGSIQEVFANQYIQQAKKTMEITESAPKKDPAQLTPPLRESSPPAQRRNDFDIPTISEIAGQSALQKHQKELSELEEIQQKIKQAKKQLKEMGSDESEDEDFLNIKANDEDLENIEDGGAGAAARRKERRKALELEKARKKAEEVTMEEERSTTPPAPAPAKKKSILERLGSRPEPKPAAAPEPEPAAPPVANKSNIISLSAHRREERELYIPVFRRKEMEEQQQHQQRAKSRETTRSRANRSRSRDRDRRRRESSRDRSRNRREREREREKERRERREREKERGRGKVSNGATEVRARIGSRVIVLPPKPEYVEEDELEVPIPSVIKIQPRPQVPKNKQPSKNLLLKAMAEAQRSTASNLKKTISNNREESGGSSSSRPKRMLIEIQGNKPDGTPPTVDVHYAEDEDDEDIVTEVLLRDDDVDDELQQILDANDEYIPEPVTISISGRSDTDSDGYVYVPAVKKASSDEQTVPEPMDEYDPKFVVTLDGAYKKSSRASPSHTPPPPGAASSTSKPSIRDRIGKKVTSSSEKSPPREDDRDHIETLKRRKERFSVKASAAAAAAAAAAKRSTSRSPEKRSSKKRSPNKKRSSSSNNNASSSSKPSTTTSGTRNRSSPADLNELLLQRTKELLVDDSVSSSPIYMSKSDYEKIEPNSSSRKRKRVSPIQFELTDDEADDTDGEYNHHRDREHRERKPQEPRISIALDDGERRREHSQRESERRTAVAGDEGERRKSGGNNGSGPYSEVKVSPTKKIKKLESSRKFDDVPQLLSSVSVPAEGLLASKSKGLIKERCKYFPSCRQGDSCEFLHPSTPCKAFPACKFGDNCLYLHPYCKFDKTCHRLDCNFMHSKPLLVGSSAGPSAPPLASSVVPVQNYKTITAKPLPALCKFYPGCTNGLCPYYHPKMCRFGRNCMNKVECNFYHHDLPGGGSGSGGGLGADFHEVHSKDKFKWISPFSA